MNKLKKIFSVTQRSFIKLFIYVNLDIYMDLYVKYLKKQGIAIKGTPKFISQDAYFDGSDYSKIEIDDNVTISREVILLTHDFSITTAMAAIGKKINRNEGEYYFSKPISIGKNCFIGAKSIILPGSSVGDNVIIGAGSVIKGSIESNSVVVGNPAKVIGKTTEFANKHLELNDFIIQ